MILHLFCLIYILVLVLALLFMKEQQGSVFVSSCLTIYLFLFNYFCAYSA